LIESGETAKYGVSPFICKPYKTDNTMSFQASNFRELCAGAPVATIKQALRNVKPSVVRELGEHYGCGNDRDMIALSLHNDF
jgi:hypothetical protein